MRRLLSTLALLAAPFYCTFSQEADSPFRFGFITDTHLSPGSHSFDDLRACIRDVNSLEDVDFVILGGDITDFGSDEEIYAAKALLDSLTLPYKVVAGNHDAKWSESGCNTFRKVFGYEQFEFEHGGWRFLGCNCGPDMRMAPALLPRESMEWLEGLEPGVPSIFINHYPQDTSVLNYFDVTRALKRAGVRFEIGGHWHQNQVLDYDGIPAVLGRSSMAGKDKPAGYNIFTVWPDSISVCERRLHPGGRAEELQWYATALKEIKDTVSYDSHGLPASYPWLRYEVNDQYPQVREIWKYQDHSNVVAGFARKGRRAWYTMASGCVRCIRLRDGKILWSRQFPGKIFSTPTVSRGRLVFGCTDGGIYALRARNGRQLWCVRAGRSVVASPVVFKGKVFAGASDGAFRALDLKTGATLWEYYEVEGFVECRPFVDEVQVVFGSWGGGLYSLDAGTGALQWEWKRPRGSRMYSPAAVWPVKSAGRIFIAVPDRRVYALDARTGEQLFWVDGGREAIGLSEDGSTVLAKTMFNTSYAFRADVECPPDGHLPDSALLWRVLNGTHYEIGPTSLVDSGGTVLTPTDKGNLFALSLKDGSVQWVHKLSVGLVNPLEVWRRGRKTLILASTMDGTVALLEVN